MLRELKDINLKKTKEEFVVKELESQPIFLIILHRLSCATILKPPFNLMLLLTYIVLDKL